MIFSITATIWKTGTMKENEEIHETVRARDIDEAGVKVAKKYFHVPPADVKPLKTGSMFATIPISGPVGIISVQEIKINR